MGNIFKNHLVCLKCIVYELFKISSRSKDFSLLHVMASKRLETQFKLDVFILAGPLHLK